MRILHVTPTYLPAVRYGGPIHSVHGLARAQARLGHQVEVFTTNVDGDGDSDVPVGLAVRMDGIEITYFAATGGRRLFRAPKMALALRSRIREFDIAHLHSVFLWPTSAAAAAARAAGVPYLLSPRGMLWPEMIRQRSRIAKTIWISLFERRNVERASAVHVTAELEAEKLRELGLRPRRTFCLANGIEPPEEMNSAQVSGDVGAATSQPGYVLSLGRLHWKKNLGALIEALAREPHLRAVIAGNDENGEGEKLRALAHRLGLERRVAVIARQVDGADKERLFAGAGLFALPSLSENFGNSVLEAMIRGIPVVSSDAAGVSEVVVSSGAGICCRPTPGAIGEALGRYLREPGLFSQMGAAGREIAVRDYGWNTIARKMTAEYVAARSELSVAA